MSMATPRLCSSLLYYWLLCGYGKSTLVFRFLSMAIPLLILMLILYGYGKSTLIVSLWVWRFLRSSLLGTESPRSLLVGFLPLWLRVLNSETLLTASVILSFFSTGHYSLSEQVFPASTANVPRHSYKGGELYSTSWSPGVWCDFLILLPHICSSPAA